MCAVGVLTRVCTSAVPPPPGSRWTLQALSPVTLQEAPVKATSYRPWKLKGSHSAPAAISNLPKPGNRTRNSLEEQWQQASGPGLA